MMELKYTWLPAAKTEIVNPLYIAKANASYLYPLNGRPVYDAISSWWCKPLGHRHELVINSINEQLAYFEHHIPANSYNEVIESLSSRLVNIFTDMDKVMYASDGSSAVEIAMKLSYESRVIKQQNKRNRYLALKNAYHGETIFTLSVCGIDSYKKAYQDLLLSNYFLSEIPYVNGRNDPAWDSADFDFVKLEEYIASIAPYVTALLIEPIVQGAAGLKIISKNFLQALLNLARKYGMHIISDEIMVGLGRLGVYSPSKQILDFEPDFVCFAKNLTAGSIPMSCVVINQAITELFRKAKRVFPHSHTHSCNALAARVAVNYLDYLADSSLLNSVQRAEVQLVDLIINLAKRYSFLSNPRAIGAIAAVDLQLKPEVLSQLPAIALEEGIFLRPIGITLYVLPPLYNLLAELVEIDAALNRVLQRIEKL